MKIDEIRIDGGTQPRESINKDTVIQYVEDIQNGATFPPVVVFYDGANYWLADGFHRLAAHKAAKLDEIYVDVQQGTRRDAILHSVGANALHGLRRTNADKRRAVIALLNDDEWSRWSDREIARRCAVSKTFVSNMRPSLATDASEPRTYTTKHGSEATMNTTNIGKTEKPQPKPDTDPEPEMEMSFDEEQKKPLVDIGGIDPQLYQRATSVGGSLSRMADLTGYDAWETASGFKNHEKTRAVGNARKIINWLEQFVQAMED